VIGPRRLARAGRILVAGGCDPGLLDVAGGGQDLLLRVENVPHVYPDRTEWRQVAQSDPGGDFEYTLPRQSVIRLASVKTTKAVCFRMKSV